MRTRLRRVSRWRSYSHGVILDAEAAGKALGLSVRELWRFVSRQYPFGQRHGWPYKVWLSELRRLLGMRYRRPKQDPLQPELPFVQPSVEGATNVASTV
jgi:hypothetical protein